VPPAYGTVPPAPPELGLPAPPPPPVSGAIPPPPPGYVASGSTAPGYGGPGYGAPGYGAAGYGYDPAAYAGYGYGPSNSGKAIAVLVLGIVSLPGLCLCWAGVITAIVALALAPSANRDIRSSGGMVSGDGFVKAGVICSIVALVLGALFIIIAVTHPGSSSTRFTP
jgi:hypothetical protein